MNFFHRYGGEFNTFLYDTGYGTPMSAAFGSWWNAHADRAIGYDASRTDKYKKALVYHGSYNIAKDGSGAPQADEAQYVLKSAADHSKPLFINYACWDGTTCAAYAGDIANPAFRTKRINMLYALYDSGYYKGLWLDDVPTRTMTTDGGQPNPYGLARQTTAYSAYLGRNMTDADWRSAMKSYMQELRAKVGNSTELLINVKWDPNVAGGGMTDADTQAIVAAANFVDLEGMSHDGNIKGGTIAQSTYSFANLRDYINRIHNAGTAVVWDDWSFNPTEREFSVANYLLMSTGNDAVGLGKQDPSNWWAGYDQHLGDAQTQLPYTWNGLQRRDFTKGLVLVKDPALSGSTAPTTVTLPRPLVNMAGDLVTQVTLSDRQAAILTDPASTGTRAGAYRADFLTVSSSSYSVAPNTRRGIAGPLTRTVAASGTRGTFAGDLDGDDVSELVKLDTDGKLSVYRVGVGTTAQTTPSYTTTVNLPTGTYGTYFGDVSGDDRADLVAWNNGSVTMYFGTATKFFGPITATLPTGFYGNKVNQLADMDGDGRKDLVAWNTNGSVRVALANGGSFDAPTTWYSQSGFVGTLANLACDVTNDGKADLVAVSPTIRTAATNSAGTGGVAAVDNETPWTPGVSGARYLCEDMDADGDADLVSWASGEVLMTRTWAIAGNIMFYATTNIGPMVPFSGNKAMLLGEFDRQ